MHSLQKSTVTTTGVSKDSASRERNRCGDLSKAPVSRRELLAMGSMALAGTSTLGRLLTAAGGNGLPVRDPDPPLREEERHFLALCYAYEWDHEAKLRFMRPRGIYSTMLSTVARAFEIPVPRAHIPPSDARWPWRTRAELDERVDQARRTVLRKLGHPDVPLVDILGRTGLRTDEATFVCRWILEQHDLVFSCEEWRKELRWYPIKKFLVTHFQGQSSLFLHWVSFSGVVFTNNRYDLACLVPATYDPLPCPWKDEQECWDRLNAARSSEYFIQAQQFNEA